MLCFPEMESVKTIISCCRTKSKKFEHEFDFNTADYLNKKKKREKEKNQS